MNIKIGAVITYNNKILVVKRNKEDGEFWQTITGSVDEGETLQEALKREVYEEVGLTGSSSYPSILYSFIWQREGVEYLEVVFLFKADLDKVKLSHEHTDYEWLELNKAIERVKMESNKIAIRSISLKEDF
jgi:8-oxo-dGTP pyrophosphatase MutT (NUDIX family)